MSSLIAKVMPVPARTLLLAGLVAITPNVAFADSSCDALFTRLQTAIWQQPAVYIDVLWTTNYFVPARKARSMGQTRIALRAAPPAVMPSGPLGPSLTGAADRKMMVVHFLGDHSGDLVDRTEGVTLRIQAAGKVMLNDRYGPYDPICSGDRFAVVQTGDSIETFNFTVESETIP